MGTSFNDLNPGDCLIIVDVQVDFCPGGKLPIENGDQVVPVLNQWIDAAEKKDVSIYLSRDWHPKNHPSFEIHGGLWPVHCLQDSEGARFHPALHLPENGIIITKGVRFDQDQNSAFDQTGLAHHLRRQGASRVFIGGLALDVCVLATALDARKAGFEVFIIQEACRPVTLQGGKDAVSKMSEAGILVV
jgi:nicotinamidase/pyrazinamidase